MLAGIAVSPKVFSFGPKHEDLLVRRLEQVDRATVVTSLLQPDEIALNEDGTTRLGGRESGGRMFTTTALLQLCQLLAPGLGQMVQDLTCAYTEDQASVSARRLAVDTINRLIGVRFDRLRGRQLVRNLQANTIDGIVGPKYRYLSNLDFYRQAGCVATDAPVVLHEALLYGRHMVLRYTQPSKRFALSLKELEGYVAGLHYANSEIGDSSVKASPMLVREFNGDTCIGPYVGRLPHAGKDFNRKLAELTHSVEHRLLATDEYRGRLLHLETQSLGLGHSPDVKVENKARSNIVSRLCEKGVGVSVAQAALRRAMLRGAWDHDEGHETLIDRQRLVLQSRTVYDVFGALLREARPLHIDAREAVEQVAYAMLTGKFSLV